jgi:hypothetical protein
LAPPALLATFLTVFLGAAFFVTLRTGFLATALRTGFLAAVFFLATFFAAGFLAAVFFLVVFRIEKPSLKDCRIIAIQQSWLMVCELIYAE